MSIAPESKEINVAGRGTGKGKSAQFIALSPLVRGEISESRAPEKLWIYINDIIHFHPHGEQRNLYIAEKTTFELHFSIDLADSKVSSSENINKSDW